MRISPGRARLLEGAGRVNGSACDERLRRARVAGQHLPGIDSGANRVGPAGEGVAELDRRADSAQGVVLVGGGHAEDRHEATIGQALDGRAVALQHGRELGEVPGRRAAGAARGRGRWRPPARGAGHEHGDRLADGRGRSGGIRAHPELRTARRRSALAAGRARRPGAGSPGASSRSSPLGSMPSSSTSGARVAW